MGVPQKNLTSKKLLGTIDGSKNFSLKRNVSEWYLLLVSTSF